MKPRREFLLGVAGVGVAGLSACRRAVTLVSSPAEARGAVVMMEGTNWVCPRWSPDGRTIAFLARDPIGRDRVALTGPRLRGLRFVGPPETEGAVLPRPVGRASLHTPDDFGWMPSGDEVVLPRVETFEFPDGDRLRGSGLWRCNVRTRILTALAAHPPEYEGVHYVYRTPRPSADGSKLAFLGDGIAEVTALGLIAPGVSSVEIERLRHDPRASIGCPAWSPDGSRLAVRRRLVRSFSSDPIETIRILQPGAPAPLVEIPVTGKRVEGLFWSPDASRLCVTLAVDAGDPFRVEAETFDFASGKWSGSLFPGWNRVFATEWRDEKTPCGVAQDSEGYLVLGRPLGRGRITPLCRLPSDDFDWSPDRRRIVVSEGRRLKVIDLSA